MRDTSGFSHIALGSARELAFISGQVAYDSDGNIVGIGDLARQTRQVLENLSHALDAVDATFDDILKFTFFVRNLSEEAVATIRKVRTEYLSSSNPPASTMVGVAALAKRDLLLEVEAYVAVPSKLD
ncbi:RidA family protein [Bradyrhizobium prioriisuperbiae]|uniref:RidA family protein n=1 Tax=Bradyrhizobium prioriisuperbiae TaxID=2854389 RepID=UPI0028F00A28|nr:RidA family protein [Bradyrhizobium prioritasuperba]